MTGPLSVLFRQGLREEFRIEQEELRGELLIGLEDLKKENKALQVKLEDLRTKNQINLEKFELEMTKVQSFESLLIFY